jgi:hypothetical protein
VTEDLILLAVEGDRCAGPAHLPARERRIVFDKSGMKGQMPRQRGDFRTQTFEEKIRLGNGWIPYSWPPMCGAEGEFVLYRRAPVTTRGGECFMCRMVAAKPVRAEYGRDARKKLHEGVA